MKATKDQYPRQELSLKTISQEPNKTWGEEEETLDNED